MAATSSSRETALEAARLIADHKGDDTVVLDISEVSGFADFFIITTAHSSVHVVGLLRELTAFFHLKGIHPMHPHKGRQEKGWILLDCGDFIIHLMEKEQREFYDLEKLWFRADRVPYWSKSS